MTDYSDFDEGDKPFFRRDFAALEADAEQEDIRWLMSDWRGRRLLWREIARSGALTPTYEGDAIRAGFVSGQRVGALRLLSMAAKLPEGFAAMLREANERDAERRAGG